ncbi:MAG: RNA methyltransferase [Candidatus Berkelbacteria bacterium]
MHEISLILDNLRSAQNVGSIFRTADGAGVKKIYLCGITPKPPQKDIDKTALGAVDSVDWEYLSNSTDAISMLKEANTTIVALEQDKNSTTLKEINEKISAKYTDKSSTTKNLALIVGNEVDGINSDILNLSELILEIPMYGQKNSLNVAVATGIALYKLNEN